jgi:hypothetical protein
MQDGRRVSLNGNPQISRMAFSCCYVRGYTSLSLIKPFALPVLNLFRWLESRFQGYAHPTLPILPRDVHIVRLAEAVLYLLPLGLEQG